MLSSTTRLPLLPKSPGRSASSPAATPARNKSHYTTSSISSPFVKTPPIHGNSSTRSDASSGRKSKTLEEITSPLGSTLGSAALRRPSFDSTAHSYSSASSSPLAGHNHQESINIPEIITGKELKILQDYFQDVDEVDEDEFIELFRSLGGIFEEIKDRDYLRFFHKVDANANGMLDLDELLTFLLVGAEGQRRMNDVQPDNQIKWIRGNNDVPNMHKGKIKNILVDMENDKYYTASRDGSIKVWNTSSLLYEDTLHQSTKSLTDMCLVKKYNQLASCDLGRQVCFYDLATGKLDRIYQGKISKLHPLHIDKPRRSKSLSSDETRSKSKGKMTRNSRHANAQNKSVEEKRKEWLQDQRENVLGAERKPEKSSTDSCPIIVLEQLGKRGDTPMAMSMFHTNSNAKFSQDFMIFGCENGTVKIYDITDRNPDSRAIKPLYSQKVTQAGVTAMKVARDLNSLILASYDSVLEVFNLEKFEKVSTLRGHTRPVFRLDYSNDMNLIVSCGREKNVLVWNPLIKKPLEVLRGHKSPVIDVQFNTKDMELITLSDDKIAKIWDIRMYKCVQTMHNVGGSNTMVTTASFNPKQECLVCGGFEYGRADLISVPLHRSHLSFKAQYSGPSHPIVAVLFKAQFGEVIIADEFTISIWNYRTGALIFKFSVPEGIAACRFDPNQRRVIVAYHNKNAGLYNYINGGRLKLLESDEEVYFNMYIDIKNGDEDCEDDNVIWGLANHEIVTWEDSEELEKEEPASIISLPFIAMCGCVVDSICILGFEDGTLRQYDSRTGAVKINRKHNQPKDIDDLVTRAGKDRKKKRNSSWPTSQRSHITNHVEFIVAPALKSPLIIVAFGNGTIEMWNAVTMEKAYQFRANPNGESICCMSCNDEGTVLLTGDSDGCVCVFDISKVVVKQPQSQHDQPEIKIEREHVFLQTRFRAFNDVVTSVDHDPQHNTIIAGSASSFAAIFTIRGNNVGYFGQTERWDIDDESTYDQGRKDKQIRKQLVDRDQYSQVEVNQRALQRMALKKFVKYHKQERRVDLEDIEDILSKCILEKSRNLEQKKTPDEVSPVKERQQEEMTRWKNNLNCEGEEAELMQKVLVPAIERETKKEMESFSKEFLSMFQ